MFRFRFSEIHSDSDFQKLRFSEEIIMKGYNVRPNIAVHVLVVSVTMSTGALISTVTPRSSRHFVWGSNPIVELSLYEEGFCHPTSVCKLPFTEKETGDLFVTNRPTNRPTNWLEDTTRPLFTKQHDRACSPVGVLARAIAVVSAFVCQDAWTDLLHRRRTFGVAMQSVT